MDEVVVRIIKMVGYASILVGIVLTVYFSVNAFRAHNKTDKNKLLTKAYVSAGGGFFMAVVAFAITATYR